MNKTETLLMTIGIPGSGKTSLVKKLQSESPASVTICPDDIRLELTGNMADQSKNGKVFQIVSQRMKEAMIDGKTIIYDATNYNRKNRKLALSLAKQFDYDVIGYEMSTPHDVSKERNAKRDRTVPDFVMDRMIAGYVSPSKDEGFNTIIKV